MYNTAQRDSQKSSFFTVDCHQTILNKANKSLKTNRKLINNDIKKKKKKKKKKQ